MKVSSDGLFFTSHSRRYFRDDQRMRVCELTSFETRHHSIQMLQIRIPRSDAQLRRFCPRFFLHQHRLRNDRQTRRTFAAQQPPRPAKVGEVVAMHPATLAFENCPEHTSK